MKSLAMTGKDRSTGLVSAIIHVMTGNLIGKLLVLVPTVACIKMLSPKEYAGLTYAMSVSTMVLGFIGPPLNRIYLGLDGDKFKQYAGSIFLGVIGIGGVLSVVLVLAGISRDAMLIGAAILFACNIVRVYAQSYWQRREQFRLYSQLQIAESAAVAICVCTALFLLDSRQAMTILVCYSLGNLLPYGYTIIRSVREIGVIQFNETITGLRFFLVDHFSVFLLFALLGLFSQLDILFLKKLGRESDLAAFGASLRYYSLGMLVVNAVNSVYLTKLKNNSNEGQILLLRRHIWICLPVAVVFLVSEPLWGWLVILGSNVEYPNSFETTSILACSSVFSLLLSPFINIHFSYHKTARLPRILIIVTLVTLYFRWMLVNEFGGIGAALSLMLGFGLFNFLVALDAILILKTRLKSAELEKAIDSNLVPGRSLEAI
ncbi:hypothetical protein N8592_00855 [Verrucomicrobia bacterium]|nr:hypothetical protein [Verrucomicrobiota bacterium]